MPRITKWLPILTLFLAAPALAEELSEFHRRFADTIETAHGAETYRQQDAVQVDAVVHFGGKLLLDGTFTFDTPVGRSRIESKGGTVMVFDGQDAWVAPADDPTPPSRARFALLTWPYFLAAPFKLADPGTNLEDAGKMPLDAHRILPAGRLTFDPGTGDAPDDWYVVYLDPDKQRLVALAYIVTYGKSEEDKKSPHLAVYEAYEEVQGVVLPTRLSFWNWDTSLGKIGEQIGSVELSNYRFIEPDEETFEKPDGARIDNLPTPPNQG